MRHKPRCTNLIRSRRAAEKLIRDYAAEHCNTTFGFIRGNRCELVTDGKDNAILLLQYDGLKTRGYDVRGQKVENILL